MPTLLKLNSLRSCFAFGSIAFATSAHAIVIPFENLELINTFNNPPDVRLMGSPGTLTGTLTAVQADFVMVGSFNGAWAVDLGIFITNQSTVDLVSNGGSGLLQIGGYENPFGAADGIEWGTGDGGLFAPPVQTTIVLTESQRVVFNGTVSDPSVFLGFLWNGDASGIWSGEITLVGLSVVPEPATYPLLLGAVVGLAALRRRHRMG